MSLEFQDEQMEDDCLVCARTSMILKDSNPYFVKELETGYVVIGDFQTYVGYTVFLCKQHCAELHDLDKNFKEKFLLEMAMVAEAVFKAFNPDKLNYELLGNTHKHMHWHIFPRRKTDKKAETAIWALDHDNRSRKPDDEELKKLKESLFIQLNKLCNNL